MNGWAWAAIALVTFEGLAHVWRIGRPRKPIAPSDAVGAVIEWGILGWLIVMAAIA